MSANDKIILEQILEEHRAERAPTASESDFFELYVAEQALKEHDLGYEELEAGVIGGAHDGGIDGFYTFVNGELAQDDFDCSPLKKNILIELVLIQAKTSNGFGESAVEKLTATSADLFDLTRNLETLKGAYSDGVLDSAATFRRIHRSLVAKFPALRFRYIYATKGDEVHPNVQRKADLLKAQMVSMYANADVAFEFLGSTELLALARREPPAAYQLSLAENTISSAGEVGYVALVRLRDFYKFICDDGGQLRRNLFESNVRDYQGTTAVNEDIAQSLLDKSGENFWWLNNGVTILATKATESGKVLTVEDPQIVNGLQTSSEIYRYFTEANTDGDERNLLVRVIVPAQADSRDRIIKATNSQTSIPAASLRATDKIHRDIEEYLRHFGLFYDRRKNFHKNSGRPLERIISIPLLAQAVMAILLQRPDDARARPSSLLKKDEDYQQVFSVTFPIELYFVCASLVKLVDSFLRSDATLDARERNNLRFYVAMVLAANLANKCQPTVEDLAGIETAKVTDKETQPALETVRKLYVGLGGGDQTAKGTQLLKTLKEQVLSMLP